MVLVIDIGNTNVKLGVFSQSGELIHSTRLSSSTHKTSDEYYLNIRDLFQQKDIAISDIEGVILSSVNPNLNYTFEHLISTYFPVKLMIVGSGIKTGLRDGGIGCSVVVNLEIGKGLVQGLADPVHICQLVDLRQGATVGG